VQLGQTPHSGKRLQNRIILPWGAGMNQRTDFAGNGHGLGETIDAGCIWQPPAGCAV